MGAITFLDRTRTGCGRRIPISHVGIARPQAVSPEAFSVGVSFDEFPTMHPTDLTEFPFAWERPPQLFPPHLDAGFEITCGTLWLTDPPPEVYRGVLEGNLLTRWCEYLGAALGSARTWHGAFDACALVDYALDHARRTNDATLCMRAHAVAPGRRYLMDALHHSTEQAQLRQLSGLLRQAVHAAAAPHTVLARIDEALAPRRTELAAHQAWVGRHLCQTFGFLDFCTYSLHAVRTDDVGPLVAIAYAPRGETADGPADVWQWPFPTMPTAP